MPPFVRKTDADRLRCMPVAGDTLMNYYKELFVATTTHILLFSLMLFCCCCLLPENPVGFTGKEVRVSTRAQ